MQGEWSACMQAMQVRVAWRASPWILVHAHPRASAACFPLPEMPMSTALYEDRRLSRAAWIAACRVSALLDGLSWLYIRVRVLLDR
jgi:hypothetical protein